MKIVGLLIAFYCVSMVAAARAVEVSATRLDGEAVSGELQGWDEQGIIIRSAEGQERIAKDELLSVRFQEVPRPSGEPNESEQLELSDGSVLPIEDLQIAGTNVTATLRGPLAADAKKLSLSRRQLVAARLQPLVGPAAAQWGEIRDLDAASDLLLVMKRDGKSIDYVEGVLGDVSVEKIEFKLDDDAVRIDRSKVAGFVMYRREKAEDQEARCVVHGLGGLKARAVQAKLVEDVVQLTTLGGVELRWPLADIAWIDFSAGKLLYLSDLEPASQQWTPLVGLPAAAELASAYGKPRRDQSAYGGPLALLPADRVAGSSGPPCEFRKGLAIRSRTELVYRLPEGFRRFTAVTGIEPATSGGGRVRLEITGDDRPLLETNIAGDQKPHPIDLDVAGMKRLRIVVDYGANLDTGDWLNLCDARLVK